VAHRLVSFTVRSDTDPAGRSRKFEERMSTKLVFPCALALAVVGIRAVHAQEAQPPSTPIASMTVPSTPAEETNRQATAGPPPTLSSWLAYPRPDCCGPIGGDGPIKEELFVRTGPSLAIGGPIFAHVLETGWRIEGGGRTLFFNPAMDAAWNIDLSISNTYFHGQHSDISIPLTLPSITTPGTTVVTSVTVRNFNVTDANLAFGREWYLLKPANACGTRWRAGIDAGMLLGSAKAEFHEIQHRTDTLAGAFVSLHTDVEVPCGCCTYLAGFRVEYGYDWMDILQISNKSDLETVDFLVTFGVRF
jgi:hypothetical protein